MCALGQDGPVGVFSFILIGQECGSAGGERLVHTDTACVSHAGRALVTAGKGRVAGVVEDSKKAGGMMLFVYIAEDGCIYAYATD